MENLLNIDPKIGNTHEQNIYQYKNLISPFCNHNVLRDLTCSNEIVVDKNYGLMYDKGILDKKVVPYGLQEMIPDYSGDELANYGFLRVPFRKIPRFLVKNRSEIDRFIESIEMRDNNLKLLYRGQSCEYFIQRNSEEKISLFGSENILEPSLIPSAVRRNILMEDIMPLWNSMLHLFLDRITDSLPEGIKDETRKELTNFKSSLNFGLFSMAMAQHYGLPSVGLDATDKIEIALFFATHSFTKDGISCSYKYNLPQMRNAPVIYILTPPERGQLNYEQFTPFHASFLRPDKQSARFLHTGWGLGMNTCARRIWVALYLDPLGEFGNIAKTEELFPKVDDFAQHLEPLIQLFDGDKLKNYFENFYVLS
ncbi:hypothetical protein MASR2M39_28640 [Ignavibacteriales bacterium]